MKKTFITCAYFHRAVVHRRQRLQLHTTPTATPLQQQPHADSYTPRLQQQLPLQLQLLLRRHQHATATATPTTDTDAEDSRPTPRARPTPPPRAVGDVRVRPAPAAECCRSTACVSAEVVAKRCRRASNRATPRHSERGYSENSGFNFVTKHSQNNSRQARGSAIKESARDAAISRFQLGNRVASVVQRFTLTSTITMKSSTLSPCTLFYLF